MPGAVRRGRCLLRDRVGAAKENSEEQCAIPLRHHMVSRVASSAGLRASVDVMARTMKLTPNTGPMPAPFPSVSQTDQVQHHATKTAFSEYKCHRIPFALSSKIGEQHASQRYFGILSVSDSTVQMPRSLTMLFCSSKTITRGSQTLASFKSNSVKLMIVRRSPGVPRCAAAPFRTICFEPRIPGIA